MLDDARLRRAGLDYREFASVREHASFQVFLDSVRPPRWFALTTKASRSYSDVRFEPDDAFLFGPETRGLPASFLDPLPDSQRLRIPMQPGSRSLNLSNAVSVVLYEAWRQNGFAGAAQSRP